MRERLFVGSCVGGGVILHIMYKDTNTAKINPQQNVPSLETAKIKTIYSKFIWVNMTVNMSM